MKKLLILLILSLLMITTMPISAAMAAIDDDLSGLTDTIVTSVNDLLNDKLNRKVTAKDVNYDGAFKVYVGVDAFKLDTTNIDEMEYAMEAGGYIYEVPLYIDGDTILVDIAKGQALNKNVKFSEEEQKNILTNVGKWQVTTVKYYHNEIVNYTTEISNKLGKVPEGTILVGGLPRFRYAVALIPDAKGEVVGLLPLSEVPGVDNIRTFLSADKNFYDYKEMREYINKLPLPNPDEAGGFGFLDVEAPNNNNTIFYALALVVTIGCAASIVYIVYRKKSVHE